MQLYTLLCYNRMHNTKFGEYKMTGIIFDVDHFAVHDGNGIRTCFYFKGCPLGCSWCHSPESQSRKIELLFAANLCSICGMCEKQCPQLAHSINSDVHYLDRDKCVVCGKCIITCPTKALSLTGRNWTIDEAVNEALQDKIFYKNSDGGVTLTGGEVLQQAEFVIELLKRLKQDNIHTIVETSGYGKLSDLLMIAEYTDLFYYDIKLLDSDKHKKHIGSYNDVILNNIKALRNINSDTIIRIPLIPSITDDIINIEQIYNFALQIGINKIHLLPYNANASAKYEWIGRDYGLKVVEGQDANKLMKLKSMAPAGLSVEVIN